MSNIIPQEFIDRMKRYLGDEAESFLGSYFASPKKALRINTLKIDKETEERLTDGMQPVPWEKHGYYYMERDMYAEDMDEVPADESWRMAPGRSSLHSAGAYYIQEPSAMAPVSMLDVRPGMCVLDLCAAPGGKSTQIASYLAGEGLLIANEPVRERAKILSQNIERMGIANAVVTNHDPAELARSFPAAFDRILVDAPCSGEGMFRKEEAALAQWSLENIDLCARRQREILEEAGAMLRPGGTLVYSTCTFATEENEETIRWFLEEHPSFSLVDIPGLPGVDMDGWGFAPGSLPGTLRLWPHRLRGEGHFTALLQKEGKAVQKPADAREEAERPARSGSVCMPEIKAVKTAVIYEADDGTRRGTPASQASTAKTCFREKKEERKKSRKGGRNKKEKTDPRRAEALRLWRGFREEALAPAFPISRPERPAGDRAESARPGSETEEKKGERKSEAGRGGGLLETMPGSREESLWAIEEDRLLLFGDALYACPVPAVSLPLEGLRVLRPGLQLGTLKKGRFEPAHALGMALYKEEVRRFVDIPGENPAAWAWIQGEAIPVREDREDGWTLVLIDGCAAGWGKVSRGLLKNHYPKGLRRQLFPG